MKDRVKIGNGRSSKVQCPSDYAPASFAAFLTDLKNGNVYLDIAPNNSSSTDAGVTEIGTPLNKSNLLADATATKFGYQATDNPNINDVLSKIGEQYVYKDATLNAGATSITITDSRITTSSHITPYIDPWGVFPDSITVSAGKVVMTFEAQAAPVYISLEIK